MIGDHWFRRVGSKTSTLGFHMLDHRCRGTGSGDTFAGVAVCGKRLRFYVDQPPDEGDHTHRAARCKLCKTRLAKKVRYLTEEQIAERIAKLKVDRELVLLKENAKLRKRKQR